MTPVPFFNGMGPDGGQRLDRPGAPNRWETAVGLAPAATLAVQSTVSKIRTRRLATGQAIPIVYGTAQVGGLVFAVDHTDGVWTLGYLFCLGEIDGYDKLLLNEAAPAEGVTVNYYRGTQTQGVDPMLQSAISGYADTQIIARDGLTIGIAYVVVQYGAHVYDNWPTVVAQVRGLKVYDPATQSRRFSANPALQLADLLASPVYGHGFTVDHTSLQALADYCDDTTLGEVRRASYLVIDEPQDTDVWVDVLRTLASGFLVRRGATIYFVADKAAASVKTITAADILRDSLRIEKQDSADLPTVVRVSYTDKTATEWRDRVSAPAELPGVSTGAVPRRESVIQLTGIDRHSQAKREAIERLNKLRLRDLSVSFVMFDEALVLEAGDVITVTHPYGLTNKLLRIDSDPQQMSPGRWRISATEYDPAVYSDEVATQPSYPDANLPSGGPPAAPTGLVIREVTYQTKNGQYASRLNIRWTASTDIFTAGYTVNVTDDLGAVVYSSNTTLTQVSTPPLRELIPYTVNVTAYTPVIAGVASATGSATIIGKTAIPDAPERVTGFEAAGEVRLQWTASTDVDAERYEVRYGVIGGTWTAAQPLDIVDGLRLVSADVPQGHWRFWVKTIDSIRQYSSGAATVDIKVTLNNDAFTAASRVPLGGAFAAMTNMHESVEDRRSPYATYYADSAQSWSSLFGSAAMNTFTSPLASYQRLTAEAIYLSPEIDLIANKSGNFSGDLNRLTFGHPVIAELGVKPAGGAYTYSDQLSQQATGRYTRLRARSERPFVVRGGGGAHRMDIVAREEVGRDTSLATGAQTVSLSRQYAAARSIVLTPEARAARSAVYDNVRLNNGGVTTFDVYIFDSQGAQVATPFRWQWKGV